MAENIRVEFTYSIPDDQYYQTNDKQLTADWVYEGPSHKWIAVREEAEGDDKPANSPLYSVPEEVAEAFNADLSDGFYAVCVDCALEPELCIMVDGENPDTRGEVSETLPDGSVYTRSFPPLLDHTYDFRKITYDRENQQWVKPFPWKTTDRTWEELKKWRNNSLEQTDKRLSEDLPQALYTAFSEYRQYLRNFTETYGAAWTITASGGTGYSVGDVIEISDGRLKNGQSVENPVITVTEVDDNGAVTAFKRTNYTAAYKHHPEAGTYENLTTVTNGNGSGISVSATKIKTVDPWKITPKTAPVE